MADDRDRQPPDDPGRGPEEQSDAASPSEEETYAFQEDWEPHQAIEVQPGVEIPTRLQGGPAQPDLAAEAQQPPGEIPPERMVPEEGIEGAAEDISDFLINIGPHHPGTHGVMRMVTRLDGERVVGLDARIGYMHRSLEKIAENRTYPQVLPFVDRTIDYITCMHSDWVYAMAAEKLMGIVPPLRAEYLRVIVGEMNRISSHLLSLGALGLDTGAVTYFLWAFAARERIIRLFEEISGARLTYCYIRIGGVAYDAPEGWIERARDTISGVVAELPDYRDLFHDNYIWEGRSRGISVLSPEEALRLETQGPILRAAGVRWDLRKDMPYSIYDRFEFDVPVGTTGDVYDRTEVRFDEIIESAKIVRQALEDIPDGFIMAHRIPRLPAPPPGEAYARVESPRGEIGCYFVSDGGIKPYRMKIRGASFHNVAYLSEISVGYTLSDLINIVGSLDPVMSDVDR